MTFATYERLAVVTARGGGCCCFQLTLCEVLLILDLLTWMNIEYYLSMRVAQIGVCCNCPVLLCSINDTNAELINCCLRNPGAGIDDLGKVTRFVVRYEHNIF